MAGPAATTFLKFPFDYYMVTVFSSTKGLKTQILSINKLQRTKSSIKARTRPQAVKSLTLGANRKSKDSSV